MKAEIISIGTELLLGHVVNTNTSYISQKMAELGIDVYYHSTVGDNEKRISDALREALKRSDIIFTTGGLGPTVDDITVATISKTIEYNLILNKQIAEDIKGYFKKRHLSLPKGSLRQSYIPEKSVWFKNTAGTAPGLIIKYHSRLIICLPGPPRELNPILERSLIPYLKKRFKTKELIRSRSIKLIGIPEAAVNTKVKNLLKLDGSTTVGIYTRLGEVSLKITAKAKNEKECNNNIKNIESKIRKIFSSFIYGADTETLEEIAGKPLLKHKKTISIAESCTGGLVSNSITDIDGSSKYFKMGIIAYSNKVKISRLDVLPKTLKEHGAVSKEVALSMAKGVRKAAGTDIGIGITGIAGPRGGTKTKPVGLVYIALISDKKQISKKFFFAGKRKEIKFLASRAALELLRKNLLT